VRSGNENAPRRALRGAASAEAEPGAVRRADARKAHVPAARHGKLPSPGPLRFVAKLAASVVAVALVSTASVGAIAAASIVTSLKPSVHLAGETDGPIPEIGAREGGFNILIAATDTRTGQGDAWGTDEDSSGIGNNDVTMLLHVAKDHKSATVVSFPRDLVLRIPQCLDNDGDQLGGGTGQLNETLSLGGENNGLACTVSTVAKLTGLDIPYAGLVAFNGVIEMSNAVGGVTVCVANGIDDPDTDLDLAPGEHTLQGKDAAEFLRTRHGVGDGSDLARISNQQVFLSALVRQIRSAGTLSNPATVFKLAKATANNIQLSASLNNVTTLYQMAMAIKDLDLDKIVFVQYPVLTDPDDRNRVIPDQDSAGVLFDALSADKPIQLGGGVGEGAVQPSDAPAPPANAPGSTDAPTSDAAATPTPSSPDGPVTLPQNVSGQQAATKTCSNGQG
jgi:LCP family protein required for cell wall assembly